MEKHSGSVMDFVMMQTILKIAIMMGVIAVALVFKKTFVSTAHALADVS